MIEIQECSGCRYYVPDDYIDGAGRCARLDYGILILPESYCDDYEELENA